MVTVAERTSADVGLVEKVTVIAVLVAAVTVPAAPLSNTTVLLPGVELNPNPLMTTVAELAAKLEALKVITGLTVAT